MTGPYITSLLSIPVSDETVAEKGVTVSKKNNAHVDLYYPIYNIQICINCINTYKLFEILRRRFLKEIT